MTPEQEQLVLDHLDIPRVVVWSLNGLRWHHDRESLVAAGNLGLVQAAVSYSYTHSCSFRSWANIRVRGAILDEVRATQFGSRSAHDGPIALHHAADRLGGQPTEAELAADLGWTIAQVQRAMADGRDTRLASLEALLGSTGRDVFAHQVPGPADIVDQTAEIAELHDAISQLSDRLQFVIVERFIRGRKMQDIAVDLGVTGSRISQLVTDALGRLQRILAAAERKDAA